MNPKRALSPFIYYLLVSVLTNIVFVTVGWIAFGLLPGEIDLNPTFVLIILFVLLIKVALISFVTGLLHKQGRLDKAAGTGFIGFYYARFFGFIIGAFLGLAIAAEIGLAVGAVTLFLAGRWIGPRVGRTFGSLVERAFQIAETPPPTAGGTSPSKKLIVGVYAGLFPLLFVLLAMLFDANDIRISAPPGEWLPAARIIVLALSLISILVPWLLRLQWVNAYPARGQSSVFAMFWIGVVFSVAPMIYGFGLFLIGASFLELCLYAALCSGATIIWRLFAKEQAAV